MSYKQRWLEYFTRLDADKSGFVDPNDTKYYNEMLPAFLGKPAEAPEVKVAVDAYQKFITSFIKEFDANKDGKVSKEELLSGVEKLFVGKTPDTVPAWWTNNIKQAFDAFDTNKNGELSEEETVAYIQKLTPKVPAEQIKAARQWAIKQSPSGKYDATAYSNVVFIWATSPTATPEASTLTPQLAAP